VQIPDDFYRRELAAQQVTLPARGTTAWRWPSSRDFAAARKLVLKAVAEAMSEEGLKSAGLARGATDNHALGAEAAPPRSRL